MDTGRFDLNWLFQQLPGVIFEIVLIVVAYYVGRFLGRKDIQDEKEFRKKTERSLQNLERNKSALEDKNKRIKFLERVLRTPITKDVLLKAMKKCGLSLDVIVIDSSKRARGFAKYLKNELGFKPLKKSFPYGRYFAPPSKTEELLEDQDINYFVKKYIKSYKGSVEPALSFVGVIDITRITSYKCEEEERAILSILDEDLDISGKTAVEIALKRKLTPEDIVKIAKEVHRH